MEFFVKYKILSRGAQFYSLGSLKNVCSNFGQNSLKRNDSTMSKIWENYRLMKIDEQKFKINNKEEFIQELGISDLIQENKEHKILMLNFHLLKSEYGIPGVSYFIDKLLKHLEPFPFNDKQLKYYEATIKRRFNLVTIRNTIEEQYLAWKYKTHPRELAFIYNRHKFSFYNFRSLGNLSRNVAYLEEIPEAKNKTILEKVFYLHQKPFTLSTISDFETEIAGMKWLDLVYHSPRALIHTQKHLLYIISFLEMLDFTEEQIIEALPYLFISFRNVVTRINAIFSNPELLKYRNEKQFLRLVLFKKYELKALGASEINNMSEFLEDLALPLPRRKNANLESLLFLFSQYFVPIYEEDAIVKKHPFFNAIPENRVRDTLEYLKSKGFTSAEVKESAPIMFYSRKLIDETLNKITEEKYLNLIGCQNGFVPKKTTNFSKGTKERNKNLQLCLYYMEKPLGFTGDAVWTEDIINN